MMIHVHNSGANASSQGHMQKTKVNSKEQQKCILKSWEEEERWFTETAASRRVYNLLQKQKLLTIVGHSGSGKSAIARHTGISLKAERYVVIQIMNGVKDILNSARDPSLNQVYIWDDPVGTEQVDTIKLAELEACTENIMRLLEISNIKVVFTCRTQVVQEPVFVASNSFIKTSTIGIHEEELRLTEKEMSDIFLKLAEKEALEESERIHISEDELKSFNFPLLCRLYTGNKTYREKGKEFFLNHFPVIVKELEKLKHSSPLKYCSLILCLIFDNKFDRKMLDVFSSHAAEDKEKISQLMEACGLLRDTSRGLVDKAMQSMEGVYLIKVGPHYNFIHDTLHEAVAYSFGKDYPLEVLKHFTSSFIKEHVRLSPSKDGHFIVLSNEHFPDLCQRLIHDIKDGNSHDVFLSPLMQHSAFIEYFAQFLNGLTNEKLTKLLNTKVNSEKHNSYQDESNMKRYSKNRYKVTILSQTGVKCIHFLLALGLSSLTKVCLKKLNVSSLHTKSLGLLPVACLGGDIEVVNILMKSSKSNFNKVWHWQKYSTLHMAVLSGKVEMVNLVIQQGVDINTSSQKQKTPLHIAAEAGFPDICNLLLNNYANFDLCTKGGGSPLHHAAYNGHTETVQMLLQNQANIDLCDKYGWSPLHLAARNGHTETVQMLLQNKANIDLCGKDGCSPLHLAARNGHTETVQLLLQNQANIDLCNKKGWSPLHVAAQNGHTETVQMLLQNKANIDLCTKNGAFPLYIAAQNGHTEIVQLLLQNKANIDLCNKDGWSPLHHAAYNGHTETVQLLLQNKANIDLCQKDGWSPLYLAAHNGHTETVQLLLQNKANIDLCDKDGWSPLHLAAQNGHTETVQMLLQNKANIDLCNKDGCSPLYLAARNGHTETVQLLLQNKAYIDLCDKDGWTPLHPAAYNGHIETVQMLLQNKANSDLCQKDGCSPLHLAAWNGHTETVQLLLQNKANIDLCNKDGCSPLHLAAQDGHTETVQLLLQNNANTNLRTNKGSSPLRIALLNRQTEVVRMLEPKKKDKCCIA